MSQCIVTDGVLTPCAELGNAIGSINNDIKNIEVSKIAAYKLSDEQGVPTKDVVFAMSSQGDNTPLVFKCCPFCKTDLPAV